MAAEHEIEEERRLFYVAMTRAKKALNLAFAQTRMRNGKHESNSPSRFIREIEARYILNPLTSEDTEKVSDKSNDRSTWGAWKKPVAQQSRPQNTYGRSSAPVVVSKPASHPQPISRPQSVMPKRVAEVDFEPTPILQLKEGQRIEHNRFGYGKILEISGPVTDLKAKISFDDHGEKILLLKYAKVRVVG